ncbi:methyltransferase domain-containing protein [Luteimonas terrae]|uniref:Class I SAM-dependent methyltransferase n=1 Tax=Luteimonas terrae TaxID=1530191 RepID=A0A4R5UEU6_9GAMM|nr:methyltransferase domain-containing protein [Luteimonas terrae]TDK33849.1 class I SAM-dependent methyltransferase [Luteimonas terrae]
MTVCRDHASWCDAAATSRAADVALSIDGQPLPGVCGLCGASAGFSAAIDHADAREGLACLACGCNARQRAVGGVLKQRMGGQPQARIHLTEHASRLYLALRAIFPRMSGSEFVVSVAKRLRLSLWLLRQGVPELVRHEDVTALGFGTGTLDALVSLDVLEHVPDASRAFVELARVISPGGVFVGTVPFYEDAEESRRVAELSSDGRIVFFGEPEYHGDPLGGGVPCFHHFGWSLLRDLRNAGFRDAAAHRVQDADGGVPHGIWVIVAER